MAPIELTLTFFIDEPSSEEIDDLAVAAREAIDEKIGESDYMLEDVRYFDVDIKLIDD